MAVKVLKSELETRSPNAAEQAVLDERTEKIGKGELKDEDLFDKEDAKPPVKEPGKEPKKKLEEGETSDADLLEAKDEDLNDEQKAKKADLVKAQKLVEGEENDKRILETDDKDLKEDEVARKKELVKEQKSQKSEDEKAKALVEEVKSYATEHKVSEEDARKDLESIGKIVENSKGDARLIAKNYHHLQRAKTRTDEELKALKNAPPPMAEVTSESVEKAIEAGKITMKGKSATKEQLIEAYRDREEDLAGLEDELVFKLLVREMKGKFEEAGRGNAAKLSSEAKDKKAKLINELSEDAKKYLPEMQPVIDRLSDAQIMSKNFSLEDMVLWSKGKAFDTSVKDAEERGFKRGVEARKILGEIKKPGEGGTKTKKTGGGKTNLTDAQQKKAEEMFATNDIPLARKYELYAEVVEHDEKLNKEKEEKDKK